MNRLLIALALILGLVLTACSPGEVEQLVSDAGLSESGSEPNQGIDLLSEGVGPLEITPGPGGGNEGEGGNIDSSGDDGSGNISKDGQQVPDNVSSDQSGSFESSPPGSGSATKPDKVVAWKNFTDNTYKFSIDYPENYVILPEIDLLEDVDLGLIYRVRFQDNELASGATADLEIPQFSVEVYQANTDTLEAFLEYRAPDANYEAFQLGDLTGYRVIFNRLIAPNEFYFFTGHGYVYKLTPMGEHGLEMLQTFKLLP
jgi:hypothetical protein